MQNIDRAQPARGPPSRYLDCEYCNTTFGSSVARRSHEQTSAACRQKQAEGRCQSQARGEPKLPDKQPEQSPGVEADDAGFRRWVDGVAGLGPMDEDFPQGDDGGGPSDSDGELSGEESDHGQEDLGAKEEVMEFRTLDELALAFRTAGKKMRPLCQAGMNRVLRVLNHPGYRAEEVQKGFPDARAVTKHLADVIVGTVSSQS